MTKKRDFRQNSPVLPLLALLLAAPATLLGQGVTGEVHGNVLDQSQAAIPGATVAVVNQDTGFHTEAPTGQRGDYIVPNLPPGKYTVTVTAKGFKEAVSKDVTVIVGSSSTVDFAMEVGMQTQTVQVEATGQLLDTASSSMGNDLSTRQVNDLPLFGRVYSQLVQIMPGAVKTGIGPSAESGSGIGANGSITAAVNGIVYQGTTFTLDGVSDMELENAFQNVTPPIDDIGEVKVSGNNANADVGVYGGAQVNAMIKSGTNQLHGSAYEFYRGRGLNANTWSNNLVGAAKPPYEANQYGGSLGGPIKRNRIFFFVGYEGLQLKNGVTYNYTVPTPMLANGYFPTNYFSKGAIYDPLTASSNGAGTPPSPFPVVTLANGTYGCSGAGTPTTPACTAYYIPKTRWDPVAAKMLAGNTIWPAPNAVNPDAPSNNYSQSYTVTDPQQKFDVKGDFVLRGQDRVFGRVSYQRNDLNTPGPTRFLNVGENASPRDHNDVGGFTHVFSPTALNEFRFGFNRFYTFHFGNDLGSNENTTLGIPNGNIAAFPYTSGIAQMSVNSNQNVGNWQQTGAPGSTDAIRFTNAYDIVDNVTIIHGRHNIRFGGDYRRLQASVTNPDHAQAGSFSFDQSYTSSCANDVSCKGASGGAGMADFLLGLPTSLSRDVVNTAPATRLTIADTYLQDDFRVTKKVTLNLALRWDLITMYNDVNNHQSNLNMATGLLDIATPGNRGPDVETNYHNFAPRVGLAYALDDKTVIRGAFGITNFPDHYGAAGGTLERNWPWFEEYVLGQQIANTPWAAVSSPQNLPDPSCTLNSSICQIGLPGFVPQQYSATVVPSPAASVYYVPPHYEADKATMWNVGVQRQLTATSTIDVAYVGTKGTNLYRSINIDQAFPGPNTVIGTGVPASISGLTANRVFATLGCTQFSSTATLSSTGGPVCIAGPLAAIQSINERGPTGYSNYNSLQVRYTKRFSHGLEALLSYTWSKEIDDMNVFVPLLNLDTYNRALGTSSAPDIPQLFIGSFVYELPVGRGRSLMHDAAMPVDLLLGGWQISGITTIQSGAPLAVSDTTSNNGGLNSGFGNRANYNPSCGSHAGVVNQPNGLSSTLGLQWFDTSCFSNHTIPYVYGNSVPGNVWGPGIVNFDLSLSKSAKVHENMEVSVRVDAFDAFNTPHFNNPNTGCCTAQNAAFGVITGAAPPRQLQLGLHFAF